MKAVENFVCVYVDADWGKKHTDLSTKYEVRGYPNTVFTDPEGNRVGKNVVGAAGVDAFLSIAAEAAKTRKAAAFLDSWETAVETAKSENKALLVFFSTAKADSAALEEALGNDSLKGVREKLVLLKTEIKKDNEIAKRFSVSSSTQPVVVVVNAGDEKPEAKILKKLTGKKGPKELQKELEAAIKAYESKK